MLSQINLSAVRHFCADGGTVLCANFGNDGRFSHFSSWPFQECIENGRALIFNTTEAERKLLVAVMRERLLSIMREMKS